MRCEEIQQNQSTDGAESGSPPPMTFAQLGSQSSFLEFLMSTGCAQMEPRPQKT